MNIRAKIFGGPNAAKEEPLLQTKRGNPAKSDSLESIKVSREAQRSANSRLEARHRLINERAELTHDGMRHEV